MRRIDPATIIAALGGRGRGSHAMVKCPSHDDKTPSLSITWAKHGVMLFHCFGGCSQHAVIAVLRKRGLWPDRSSDHRGGHAGQVPKSVSSSRVDRSGTDLALSIWRRARPIAGTVAEAYLKHRGAIDPARYADLGFCDGLQHPSGHRGPALIAAFRRLDDDRTQACHRIWLKPNGTGKAEIENPKMMLGPVAGCAIKLVADAEVTQGLGVCEGIETAVVATSRFGWRPIWALGSAGAIAQFPVLHGVEGLTIFADNDLNAVGMSAARTCAARWCNAGREVRILLPRCGGLDWADVATHQGTA